MSNVKSVVHNLGVAAVVPTLDLLGLHQLHSDTVLYSQMKRMDGVASAPEADGKRILFMTLKGTWKSHLAWEYALASALRVRGAECSFLLCDKCFPKCDVKVHYNPTRSRCWACHAHSRVFAKYLGMPALWMGDFVTEEERARLTETAFGTPYQELSGIRHNDIDIDHTIRPSLYRFFRRGSLDGSDYAKRVHREFILGGLLAATALPKMLEREKPDTVFTVNAMFYAESILYQLCRKQGIDIYTYERGKIKDTLNIVRNQVSVDWDNTYAWNTVKDRDLTPEERRVIEDYIGDRKLDRKTVMHFHPNPQEDEAIIKKEVGFQEGKKHFVLFPNLIWDTGVQYKETGFESMFEWMRLTVEFFAKHPEANLILRLHPAEVRISSDVTMEKAADFINSVFPKLPGNVLIVSPESDVSSYKLIELSDAVIVYTSTVGIESALAKTPTVVCAKSHFGGKGFTVDVATKEEYYTALDRLIAHPERFDFDWDAAWKYAYVFFFLCMLPFPFVSESRIGGISGVSFRSWGELMPGRNRDMDLICDAILDECQILPAPGEVIASSGG